MDANGSNGRTAAPDARSSSPEQLVERVQHLTERVAALPDPAARQLADELVGAVVELYGEGLERIFAAIGESGEAQALGDRLVGDGVVASLMLIHDLYPVPLDERVADALDSVRPYMESHGGNVELLGIERGIARIRLEGSCEGCPASASTLELAIKTALDAAAPDLEGLVVEGAVAATPATPGPGATELPVVQVAPGAEAPSAWIEVDGVEGLAENELTLIEVEGTRLAVARAEGHLLAFRDSCAGCGASLGDAELDEGTLRCASCERRFFLPRAGRSLDDDRLLLEPVPLLAGSGPPRVALSL